MKNYQVTRESEYSNRIVSELNASVLSATFPCTTGTHKADLYSTSNSGNKLVFHNTCGPANSELIETVNISF